MQLSSCILLGNSSPLLNASIDEGDSGSMVSIIVFLGLGK